MEYLYYIYKHTNKNNGKVYIGQTRDTMEERSGSNGSNYRGCPKFYNAIQSYGWDAFLPEIIDTAQTQDEAYEKEKYYISCYHSTDDKFGYNLDFGGQGGATSPGARELISQKAKERYIDPTKNPMYGKKHTDETRKKQREKKLGSNNPMYGTTWTDTQRARSGTRGMKLNLTEEQRDIKREHMRTIGSTVGLKPIRCLTDDMEFLSCTAASKFYKIPKPTITDNLKGRSKTCHGLRFEYIIQNNM